MDGSHVNELAYHLIESAFEMQLIKVLYNYKYLHHEYLHTHQRLMKILMATNNIKVRVNDRRRGQEREVLE